MEGYKFSDYFCYSQIFDQLVVGNTFTQEQGTINMSELIPWSSQPLALWARKYAQGKFVDLDGRKTHYIIENSTEVGLTIQRKQFFDKLSDEIHRLAQLEASTLIVWGREGKATPLRLGQEMHRILKGSRLEIFDNAGHVPNFDQAKKFNQLAVDFLGE